MFNRKAYNKIYYASHKLYYSNYRKKYYSQHKKYFTSKANEQRKSPVYMLRKKEWDVRYYQKHKVAIDKQNSLNRLKYRAKVINHYGNVCNCCGETNQQFLTIDHVNNDGYKEVDKNGVRLNSTLLCLKIIRDGFPDTYQILCANCNHGKRMNNGICPHKN